MNTQLVNSLVEVVLNLTPEDQNLFQSQLIERQAKKNNQKYLESIEKAEQFRQWVADFPKSDVSLPTEAMNRESIYGDRGV
jgi:hypothetical protein